MSKNAKENLQLLVFFLFLMGFCVWASWSCDRDNEQACRAIGGTPVVLYNQDQCWPGGVTH